MTSSVSVHSYTEASYARKKEPQAKKEKKSSDSFMPEQQGVTRRREEGIIVEGGLGALEGITPATVDGPSSVTVRAVAGISSDLTVGGRTAVRNRRRSD